MNGWNIFSFRSAIFTISGAIFFIGFVTASLQRPVSLSALFWLRLPADGRRDGQGGGECIVRHLLVHHFQSVQPAGVVGVVGEQRGRGRVIQRLQGETIKFNNKYFLNG